LEGGLAMRLALSEKLSRDRGLLISTPLGRTKPQCDAEQKVHENYAGAPQLPGETAGSASDFNACEDYTIVN